MKKNNLILIGIVTLIFISLSIIVYGVKKSTYKYTFQIKATFYCKDEIDCDYDDINDLYKQLEKYLYKKENINYIVDKIKEDLDLRLSSEEVKSAIKLTKKVGFLELTIKHKNISVADLIYRTILYNSYSFELEKNIKLVFLDSKYISTPILWKHIVYGTSIGILVSLFLVASGFELKKTNQELKKS